MQCGASRSRSNGCLRPSGHAHARAFLLFGCNCLFAGKPYDSPLYGWDNEYGSQTSMVPPFKASKFLVTNREFLEFGTLALVYLS